MQVVLSHKVKVCFLPSSGLCSQGLRQVLFSPLLVGNMQLTCLGDILSQENYLMVMSIALRLPRTGYGPLDLQAIALPISGLTIFCFFPFSATRPMAQASSSLLIATKLSLGQLPFPLLHGSCFHLDPSVFMPLYRRRQIMAILPYVLSSFSSHMISNRLAAYRLLKLRPLTCDLLLSINMTFPLRPFAKNLTFFLIIHNFLAHVSAIGPYNLLPFWRISMSLPHKDSCLNRRCLL